MLTPTLTPIQQVSQENRIILRKVSWSTYQALMTDVGEDRGWRIADQEAVLELRMPLQQHEVPNRLITPFIQAIADELEIEVIDVGSLLLEREDLSRAIEPDPCCYLQNEAIVRWVSFIFP